MMMSELKPQLISALGKIEVAVIKINPQTCRVNICPCR